MQCRRKFWSNESWSSMFLIPRVGTIFDFISEEDWEEYETQPII